MPFCGTKVVRKKRPSLHNGNGRRKGARYRNCIGKALSTSSYAFCISLVCAIKACYSHSHEGRCQGLAALKSLLHRLFSPSLNQTPLGRTSLFPFPLLGDIS